MKKCKLCGKEICVRSGNYVNYYRPIDLTNPNVNKMESYHFACFLYWYAGIKVVIP
jgi:hypothetical protein